MPLLGFPRFQSESLLAVTVNHWRVNFIDANSANMVFPSRDRLPLAALCAQLFSCQRLTCQIIVSALFKLRAITRRAQLVLVFLRLFFSQCRFCFFKRNLERPQTLQRANGEELSCSYMFNWCLTAFNVRKCSTKCRKNPMDAKANKTDSPS